MITNDDGEFTSHKFDVVETGGVAGRPLNEEKFEEFVVVGGAGRIFTGPDGATAEFCESGGGGGGGGGGGAVVVVGGVACDFWKPGY